MKKFDEIIERLLVTESPIFYDGKLSIDLDNELTNKQSLDNCVRDGQKLKKFEDWEVYKIQKENFEYYCFIKNNIVDAYVEFFIENLNVNNKRVLQKNSASNKGLLKRAFLKYFSDIFSSVILDKRANTYGKQFFEKLMSEAINGGFKTTIVNERTGEEASYIDKNFEQYWLGKTVINNKAVGHHNILFKIYYK